jgi:hypothetical protein
MGMKMNNSKYGEVDHFCFVDFTDNEVEVEVEVEVKVEVEVEVLTVSPG